MPVEDPVFSGDQVRHDGFGTFYEIISLSCQKILVTFKILLKEGKIMDKYECSVCGYVYDPEDGDPDNGIDPGTSFETLPDDWTCPVCGAGKDQFEKE